MESFDAFVNPNLLYTILFSSILSIKYSPKTFFQLVTVSVRGTPLSEKRFPYMNRMTAALLIAEYGYLNVTTGNCTPSKAHRGARVMMLH